MTRWLVLALPLLWAAALGATEAPRLDRVSGPSPDARWQISDLPAILAEEEVERHLATGLTTSFVFHLTARDSAGGKRHGGARVEVRYELWDEVYQVTSIDIDGRALRHTAPSRAALEAWWHDLRLTVLRAPAADLALDRPMRLSLEVVPFSRAERDDAQRWFLDSLDNGTSSAEELTHATEEQPERQTQVLNLLLATSIQQRALRSYRWTIPPPGEAS